MALLSGRVGQRAAAEVVERGARAAGVQPDEVPGEDAVAGEVGGELEDAVGVEAALGALDLEAQPERRRRWRVRHRAEVATPAAGLELDPDAHWPAGSQKPR